MGSLRGSLLCPIGLRHDKQIALSEAELNGDFSAPPLLPRPIIESKDPVTLGALVLHDKGCELWHTVRTGAILCSIIGRDSSKVSLE